jgi:adenine-specific DNA-methyltransferase
MNKLRMESPDMTAQNIDRIAALFPNCITEMLDEEHSTPEKKVYKRAVNFELLKQMLSPDVVDGDEAYEFTWVGKKAAIVEANKPIRKTLRPCVAESKDWDNTENLYIEGDNLEVLKLLQESYLGKVKMIYIDPPYNTGNDFIYADDFMRSQEEENAQMGMYDEDENRLFKNTDTNGRFHSDWCSMIYSRLMLARNLLTDDGVIFISIDDNEIDNLRKVCDEVFGEDNLVNCFVWNCSTAGGIRPKFASKTHEYIVCYAKNKDNLSMFFVPLSSDAKKMYTQKDEKGLYRDKDFIFKNKSTNINQKYPIECPDGEKVHPKEGYIYRFIRTRFDEALAEGLVTFKRTNSGPLVTESGAQAHWNIYIKKYLGDAMGAPSTLIPKEMMSIYNVGTQCVQNLFDDKRVFENVKPVDVITYLINMTSDDDSVILDFFSGSATTAHAVMQLNAEDGGHRKFIMVQLSEKCDETSEAYKAGYKTICEIGKERIRRAGDKIKSESPMTTQDLDIGFRVLKLDDTNMKDVYYAPDDYDQGMLAGLESNIKDDRTDLDLLFGCLIDWGLPLSLPYKSEQLGGCTVHTYNDGDLIACFDANIPESVVKEIAQRKPLRAVFRDSGFASSPEKINVFEIFKLYMPEDANDISKRVRVI